MNERKYLISFNEFSDIFSLSGLTITPEKYRKFELYARLLVQTNEKFNLTAITEPREIAIKHFLDSVLPLTMFSIPVGASLADVGTGAGFPGVPLKIMRPDLKLTLIDSLLKRVNFLKQLTEALDVEAECLHARAEDLGRVELRGKFDFVTARAVSRMEKLAGYCLPLLKPGGVLLALKGGDCEDELKAAESAITRFGGHLESAQRYKLPGGDGRTLVCVRKG